MKNENSVFTRIQSSILYHAESWGLIPKKYPKILTQRKIDRNGIFFEVENLVEANRIRFLDDEKVFLHTLVEKLTLNDIFFDIGACLGLFSLHAAKKCNQVVAFEPEPEFRKHLIRNMEINDVTNLIVLPFAISDRSQERVIFTDGIGGKSPSLSNNGFKHEILIKTRTLDAIIEHGNLQPPTIMKMDIEGAEILALKGMKRMFHNSPPRLLFFELHPKLLESFHSNSEEVFSLMAASGYKIVDEYRRDMQIHVIFSR
jgi:FkbM family methyltransferase